MAAYKDVIAQLTSGGAFETVVDESAGYPVRVYRNAPPSLRAILEATRAFGDRTFLIYADEVVTFAAHFSAVANLAQYLRERGIAKGDRVALGMRNFPEWSTTFWACQAIGAVVVSLNAWWTANELAFALEDSQAVALVIDGERLDRIGPMLATMRINVTLVARRTRVSGIGVDLEPILHGRASALPDCEVRPDDLATILYTSGTTGKPKGAVATHRNYITSSANAAVAAMIRRSMEGLAPPDPAGPQPGMLVTFPLFHVSGLCSLINAAASGIKVALQYKWVPAEAVALVEHHRLTNVAGVPIVLRQLLDAADQTGAAMASLVGISGGGAPIPPDLVGRIGERFDRRVAPGNGYGLTETAGAITSNMGASFLAAPDSVGRPLPGVDIRIAGDDGSELPQGEKGELWVRGANVNLGYWRNPEATAAAFADGWFRSGDLAYVDEQGRYHVVDRIKDVIIRGGENVYSVEVEAQLLAMSRVRDAVVVGLPHPLYGEEVGAVIQVSPDDCVDSTTEVIRQELGTHLARFKIPSAVKLITEDLPRTASGKVLKQQIRERYFPE